MTILYPFFIDVNVNKTLNRLLITIAADTNQHIALSTYCIRKIVTIDPIVPVWLIMIINESVYREIAT